MIDRAVAQLLAATDDPLLALDAAEEKMRREHFLRFWQPIPEQRKFFQAFKPDAHKTFIVLGGNRGGKTMLTAFLALAWALGKEWFKGYPAYEWVKDLPIPEPPNTVWYVGLDYGVLRDVIWYEKFRAGADHPPLLPKNSFSKCSDREGDMRIEFHNGSVLLGKSADAGAAKLQSAAVDLVCIDEEPDKEVYDEAYQRTVSRAGKIIVSLTPLTDIASTARVPWVFDLLEKAEAGDPAIGFCHLFTLENPYIAAVEKENLKRKWEGTDEESARLYGGFIRRGGLIYPNWKAEPPLWVPPRDLPKQGFRAVCVDPASSGPVAAVWAHYDAKGFQTVYRVYKEKGLAVSEHVQNILTENRGDPIDLWLLDPYAGKQTVQASSKDQQKTVLQVWRDAGLQRLRLADVKADKALEESREYLKAGLDPTSPHPGFCVFDTCEPFKYEIERYINEVGVRGTAKGQSKDRPKKGNDDVLNAWQYLCGMNLRYRGGSASMLPKPDPLTSSSF